ncbi:MAG: hypothetical protein AABX51_01925 [Nanoarchaeota archaeon]
MGRRAPDVQLEIIVDDSLLQEQHDGQIDEQLKSDLRLDVRRRLPRVVNLNAPGWATHAYVAVSQDHYGSFRFNVSYGILDKAEVILRSSSADQSLTSGMLPPPKGQPYERIKLANEEKSLLYSSEPVPQQS